MSIASVFRFTDWLVHAGSVFTQHPQPVQQEQRQRAEAIQHRLWTLGLGFLPDLTQQFPFCVHWQEHIWSLGMSWLDFLLMPPRVASHATCTSVGSLCFGQFGVCSLDHSSSPAFFGRCRRKMSAEESWRRRPARSFVQCTVFQMSMIWYVVHVFSMYTCVLLMKRNPPTNVTSAARSVTWWLLLLSQWMAHGCSQYFLAARKLEERKKRRLVIWIVSLC